MKAREIMTEQPAWCTPNDTLQRVAHLMEEHDCGCLPVVEPDDGNRVIGVVTDRDIVLRAVGHGRPSDAPVREFMTASALTCHPDTDLSEVEKVMTEEQVRRVVITDDGGHCVGIISQADLARAAERAQLSDDEIGRIVEQISEPSRRSWRL